MADQDSPERNNEKNTTKPTKHRSNREYLNKHKNRKKHKHIALIIVAALIIIGVLAVVISGHTNSSTTKDDNNKDTAAVQTKDNENNTEEETYTTVSFAAVGDNLIHNTIYDQAAARATGSDQYDFSYCYKDVASIIGDTDLAFVNQETPLATAIKEPSNYPMFNTPSETVYALKDIGFNAFNLATNHSLDMGVDGISATLDVMDSLSGTVNCGEYRDEDDLYTPHTITVNGVTFAFVGFTEMTNGIVMPSDTDIKLIYDDDEETIKKMIKAANKAADVTVVSCHWGTENSTTVTDTQKELAQKIADWGGDIILGTHPHVLQEIDTLTAKDGRSVPVFYSMGNFISAMSHEYNHIGGIFTCDIKVNNETKEVSFENIAVTPTICYFTSGYKNIHVITYEDYIEKGLDGTHGLDLSEDYIDSFLKDSIGTKYLTYYGSMNDDSSESDA